MDTPAPPPSSASRLPRLQDAALPRSARENYALAVDAISFWTDAYKLASDTEQRTSLAKDEETFNRYIIEAIEDAKDVCQAADAGPGVQLIRLLTYLDDRLTLEHIQQLFTLFTTSWNGLQESVQREAISFLCDTL